MIGRTNSSVGAGNAVRIDSVPAITFSGKSLPWHIELYGGLPYWELWCLSSGTLRCNVAYTVDVWGIGGGSAATYSSSAFISYGGNSGTAARKLGISLASGGTVSVTIGAGASNAYTSSGNAGGDTKFGSHLTCAGGAVPTSTSCTGHSYRYRFMDSGHTNEKGADKSFTGGYGNKTYTAAGGWLPLAANNANGASGEGFGAGGGYGGTANSGALVIRIPI